MSCFWNEPDRIRVPEGVLRLLSVRELQEARRESEALAAEDREQALCSNACILARAMERDGAPVFADGRAVLGRLCKADIERLARCWGEFNRASNPSPLDGEAAEAGREALRQDLYGRLRWQVLKAFGVLPGEERARAMTDRDYLWCALNLELDREEELDRLCPRCREQAEEENCPVCGESRENWGHSTAFDPGRFGALKGESADD